jgi:hypothetical protein
MERFISDLVADRARSGTPTFAAEDEEPDSPPLA